MLVYIGGQMARPKGAYIAIFAFVVCTTVGKAHLQATSGRDLQVNPGIAVQLQKVELL
jgi:hypothetical protein